MAGKINQGRGGGLSETAIHQSTIRIVFSKKQTCQKYIKIKKLKMLYKLSTYGVIESISESRSIRLDVEECKDMDDG
jgi:hypothetical protein